MNEFYENLEIDDQIYVTCDLRKARNKRNPAEFDYYQYLLENQITALGYIKNLDSVKVIRGNKFFSNTILTLRKLIDSKLKLINDKKTYSLIRGLILADRSLIEYDDKQNFVNSGVIHVLAVSGLHVGFIAIIFYALFSRFHIFTRSILTIAGLLFFMFLTGVPASVFRATLMAVILILSRITGRSNNIFNNLAIAGLVILIINPTDILNPGFQLSFSAVLSIIIFAPYFDRNIKKLKLQKSIKAIFTLFAVSFAAQIGTLPFTLYYFGKLSLISLVANLIVIPLIGIIVGIAITGLFLSFLSISISVFYSITNNLLTEFLFALTEFTGNMKYSFIQITNFSIWDSLSFYIFLIIICSTFIKSERKIVVLLICIIAIFTFFQFKSIDDKTLFPKNEFCVCAIDVGQGDSFLIKFPNGKTALIDAGNATPYFDNGERVILPLLNHLEISKLDYVFITHLDSDHYKGVLSLIKADKVNLVYKPPLDSTLKKDHRFEKFLKNHNVNFRHYSKEILDIGNCRLYFLADTKSHLYKDFDVNNKSGIIKIIHGNNTFLFVGDAEFEMESYLANCYTDFLQSDYLKVSHHGSKTGSIPEFLSFVKPKISVISAGIENKFNHPSPEIEERLKQFSNVVDRTDKKGAVIYKSDGNTIKKIAWRK